MKKEVDLFAELEEQNKQLALSQSALADSIKLNQERLKELHTNYSKLTETTEKDTKIKGELRKGLRIIAKKFHDQEKGLLRENDRLAGELKIKGKHIHELEKRVDMLRKMLSQQANQDLKAEMHKTKAAMSEMQHNLVERQKKLMQQLDAERVEHREAFDMLQDELVRKEAELSQANAKVKTRTKLSLKMSSELADRAKIESGLAHKISQEIVLKKKLNESLQEELSKAKSSLKDLNDDRQALIHRLDQETGDRLALQLKLDSLKGESLDSTQQLIDLKKVVKKHTLKSKEIIDELHSRLRTKDSEISSLSARLDKDTHDLADMDGEVKKATEAKESFHESGKRFQRLLQVSSKQMLRAMEENGELRQRLQKAVEARDVLETKMSELITKNQAISEMAARQGHQVDMSDKAESRRMLALNKVLANRLKDDRLMTRKRLYEMITSVYDELHNKEMQKTKGIEEVHVDKEVALKKRISKLEAQLAKMLIGERDTKRFDHKLLDLQKKLTAELKHAREQLFDARRDMVESERHERASKHMQKVFARAIETHLRERERIPVLTNRINMLQESLQEKDHLLAHLQEEKKLSVDMLNQDIKDRLEAAVADHTKKELSLKAELSAAIKTVEGSKLELSSIKKRTLGHDKREAELLQEVDRLQRSLVEEHKRKKAISRYAKYMQDLVPKPDKPSFVVFAEHLRKNIISSVQEEIEKRDSALHEELKQLRAEAADHEKKLEGTLKDVEEKQERTILTVAKEKRELEAMEKVHDDNLKRALVLERKHLEQLGEDEEMRDDILQKKLEQLRAEAAGHEKKLESTLKDVEEKQERTILTVARDKAELEAKESLHDKAVHEEFRHLRVKIADEAEEQRLMGKDLKKIQATEAALHADLSRQETMFRDLEERQERTILTMARGQRELEAMEKAHDETLKGAILLERNRLKQLDEDRKRFDEEKEELKQAIEEGRQEKDKISQILAGQERAISDLGEKEGKVLDSVSTTKILAKDMERRLAELTEEEKKRTIAEKGLKQELISLREEEKQLLEKAEKRIAKKTASNIKRRLRKLRTEMQRIERHLDTSDTEQAKRMDEYSERIKEHDMAMLDRVASIAAQGKAGLKEAERDILGKIEGLSRKDLVKRHRILVDQAKDHPMAVEEVLKTEEAIDREPALTPDVEVKGLDHPSVDADVDEIVPLVQLAIQHEPSLDKIKNSLINSGYSPENVEEAVKKVKEAYGL
ncbi:MAG: hypothetical protein KJ709_07455 [Nanoarchaeota archaeon]|nr:hypothetical protein [Nanoarchaeota archaeon]